MTEDGCRAAGRASDRSEQLAGVGTWHLDLATGALTTNDAARVMLGWSGPGTPQLADFLGAVHPDDAAEVAAAADLLVRTGTEYVLEHRVLLPDGRLRFLRASAAGEQDADGRTSCLHGICLDVTDLHQVTQEAQGARDRSRAVLDTLREGYLLSAGGVVLEVNDALCATTGWSRADLVGRGLPYPFFTAQADAQTAARVDRAWTRGGDAEMDAVSRTGEPLRLSLTATRLATAGDDRRVLAVLLRDVTAERAREDRLRHQAQSDALTGLPNSRAFRAELVRAVASHQHAPLSLAIVDVDHFKDVNDRYGHAVGDEVLVAVAARLAASTASAGRLARVGGEEFALLMPGLTATDGHRAVGTALQELRTTPLPHVGTVTASAGVAQLLDGMDDDALYRLADALLYEAKARGRDQVR